MNTAGWASIRNMKSETALRRMVWPNKDMNILSIPNWPVNNARGLMLEWIEEHTTGMFYLGGVKVAFEDEKDEIMFRLRFA